MPPSKPLGSSDLLLGTDNKRCRGATTCRNAGAFREKTTQTRLHRATSGRRADRRPRAFRIESRACVEGEAQMVTEITWRCECGNQLEVPAAMAGKEYACPYCRQRGWIPKPVAPPPRPKRAESPLPPEAPTPWESQIERQRQLFSVGVSLRGIASTIRVLLIIASIVCMVGGCGACTVPNAGPAFGVPLIVVGVSGILSAFIIGGVLDALGGILLLLIDLVDLMREATHTQRR